MVKHEPLDARMGLGNESLDREGRIITLEYPAFYIINAYCPNSQESPHRRAFRARWDEALFCYVRELHETKPVMGENEGGAYADLKKLSRPTHAGH